MGSKCQTKYPIVLVHGAGLRDRFLMLFSYWGRIPSALKKEGAVVYYGRQDCWASVETNAEFLSRRIDEILLETGSEKVNIVAHSKGGLDSRMAASSFGCGDKIASITTIATPHRGSKTMDKLLAIPKPFWKAAAFVVNVAARVMGDKHPDFLKTCAALSTDYMRKFNEQNPDVPGIYYQSFACVMSRPLSDIIESVAYLVVKRVEGDNDGLVTVESARWGSDFHIVRSNSYRGISHIDAIDFRRRRLSRKKGPNVSDIRDVYIDIVSGLKKRGL